MIVNAEEIYTQRGKVHRSIHKFMDNKTLHIEVRRMKKQGKEVEEIAIELGISNDEVSKILKRGF